MDTETLIIARHMGYGRILILCRLVKRTPTRAYCTLHDKSTHEWLHGTRPNTYVNAEDVVAEGVTVEQFEALRTLDEQHKTTVKRYVDEYNRQMKALHADQARELRALIDSFAVAVT